MRLLPGATVEVFICYAREEKKLVNTLESRLVESGRTIWLDVHRIEPSVQWRQAIERGIDMAINVIFVLSPDAIDSTECRRELGSAFRHNKRLIPILAKSVEGCEIPEAVANIQMASHCDRSLWAE